MQKNALMALIAVFILSAFAYAQMGGGMHEMMEGEEQEQPYYGGYGYGHGPGCGMMGSGWGMGPGMMGPGWGMGPGMMGPGWGMGPGMMGPGWGMGPGMMGPGWGMGPGTMGPGWGMYSPEGKKFLDDTLDLRRQLHMKKFDYFEALRSPGTKPETLRTLRKEITDLMNQLHEKQRGK